MDDDEFTGAGDHLAKIKAAISAQLKNASSDVDIFSVLGSGTKSKRASNEKCAASSDTTEKEPSPPKIKKVVQEDLSPEIVASDVEESPDESQDEILLSSDDEYTLAAIDSAKRKTEKENNNRKHHFRMREYDASFNEDQKILSYLDHVNQKDSEDKLREKHEHSTESEQNCEMNVKVRWNCGRIERYRLRKMQPFKVVFEALSIKHDIAVDKIMLEYGDDHRICPGDTPDSLGITVAHILNGCALREKVGKPSLEDRNKDKLEIKIQFPDRKVDKISFYLDPEENFSKIYMTLAETLQLSVEKLRLQFEGELVDQKQTAEDLDLESGDVVDCLTLS
ncbi:uncharacterized protein LOC135946273 [Cloeon dipterum]|uniref:uncharacterized protein LOC135946273 n=1 Tax=Cloeon dipterum TaxID=197152 RepID=UPI00321F9697